VNSGQLLLLLPAFIGGAGAGILNYLGLWLTVKRVAASRRPVLLVLTSMGIRTALCLGVFYLVMAGDPLRLLVCLAGFFLVRLLSVQKVQKGRPAATVG
jgi:F1F0 ATPase subunit 2